MSSFPVRKKPGKVIGDPLVPKEQLEIILRKTNQDCDFLRERKKKRLQFCRKKKRAVPLFFKSGLPPELDLSYCKPALKDVSIFSGLKKLTLSSKILVDVSALCSIEELNLFSCTSVVDVSSLGGVQKLNLSYCTAVVDVSALGGVQKLILIGCTGVVDVSMLGKVEELNLRGCTGVRDVSALGGVEILNLSQCTGVTDFSAVPQAIRFLC